MKRSNAEALRRYHASRTPEQKAAWRKRVSQATAEAVTAWHGQRSPEAKEATRERCRDAALCRTFAPRRPGHRLPKGKSFPMSHTPEAIAARSTKAVQKASIARILREIVVTEPEMIRAALVEGISAPPPKSFPYLMMAASYLDGKPIDLDPDAGRNSHDLSGLSNEELISRATAAVERMRRELRVAPAEQHPVIDVTPTSEESR